MSSSENTLPLPVGELPETIESRWQYSRARKCRILQSAILAVSAFGVMRYRSFKDSSDNAGGLFLEGAFAFFFSIAAMGMFEWAFGPRYSLNVNGITIRRALWPTTFMAWGEVENVKVCDPDEGIWNQIYLDAMCIKIYGAQRHMFRKSVDLDTSKFDDIGDVARYVLKNLPDELQHDVALRRWAGVR